MGTTGPKSAYLLSKVTRTGKVTSPASTLDFWRVFLFTSGGEDFHEIVLNVQHDGNRAEAPGASAEHGEHQLFWKQPEKQPRPGQETHERFHGVVAGPKEKNGTGEPQNAQFGNKQATRGRVETSVRE